MKLRFYWNEKKFVGNKSTEKICRRKINRSTKMFFNALITIAWVPLLPRYWYSGTVMKSTMVPSVPPVPHIPNRHLALNLNSLNQYDPDDLHNLNWLPFRAAVRVCLWIHVFDRLVDNLKIELTRILCKIVDIFIELI